MLKLQFCSDLHIEYKNDDVPDPRDFITPCADILILTGDIGSIYKTAQLTAFLTELCELFQQVLYIPGNQEYYQVQGIEPVGIDILISKLMDIEAQIPNLTVMRRKFIVVGDVCIVGATLWSDAKVKIPRFIVRIHDITNEYYRSEYEADLSFINSMIEHCAINSLKLVVATHYCPTFRVMTNGLNDYVMKTCRKERFSSLYMSQLDNILDAGVIDAWICGHIHKNFDFKTGGRTRVVGNQYGKPKDNIRDYSKTASIEL